MSDIRPKLRAAKDDIESKSGQKFSREYLALADLVSEFVAIKVADQLANLKPVTQAATTVSQPTGKPSDDFLYGN
jgi:hypothetical protein